jgi:hypothetical protein
MASGDVTKVQAQTGSINPEAGVADADAQTVPTADGADRRRCRPQTVGSGRFIR